MKQILQSRLEIAGYVRSAAQLDLVVPFTTPRLSEVALRAAARLGTGLNSAVRVVKVQVVPFPLDMNHPPVPAAFLQAQLQSLCCEASSNGVVSEICYAREFEEGLRSMLRYKSLVVLASRKRPWRTRNESLAASLRLAGYTVVMVDEEKENA